MPGTVFIGDTRPLKLQLQLTNFAEKFERPLPRYYVRRITFTITILDDEDGCDDVVTPLSAEDQELLSWQAKTQNLQDDVEVRTVLTSLSGRLCPYKNISLTLCGKVTDQDTHQQRIEPHRLSSYRHVSFRSAMFTKHSAPDGQSLLFSVDGLPLDRSRYRWRSRNNVKLDVSEPRSSFRAFWLEQWDIVDMWAPISDGHDATTRRGIISRWSSLDHPSLDCQRESTGKHHGFHGIRRREQRKTPWIAEVRQKGIVPRKKIWIGSFDSAEEAARAADAGFYYYKLPQKFNFSDSPSHLQQIPGDLSEADLEKFVKEEAKRLAQIPPLAWISENQSSNPRWTRGFTSSQPRDICYGNNYTSDSVQLSPNANFVQGLPRLDDFTLQFMDSGSALETNQPSTSYGNDRADWLETLDSSLEENPWQSPSNGSFSSIPPLSAGILYPELEYTDMCEPSPPPVFNTFTCPEVNNEPDMSSDIAGQSPTVNNSRFNDETEAASMSAERNGDYARDSNLFDWLLK